MASWKVLWLKWCIVIFLLCYVVHGSEEKRDTTDSERKDDSEGTDPADVSSLEQNNEGPKPELVSRDTETTSVHASDSSEEEGEAPTGLKFDQLPCDIHFVIISEWLKNDDAAVISLTSTCRRLYYRWMGKRYISMTRKVLEKTMVTSLGFADPISRLWCYSELRRFTMTGYWRTDFVGVPNRSLTMSTYHGLLQVLKAELETPGTLKGLLKERNVEQYEECIRAVGDPVSLTFQFGTLESVALYDSALPFTLDDLVQLSLFPRNDLKLCGKEHEEGESLSPVWLVDLSQELGKFLGNPSKRSPEREYQLRRMGGRRNPNAIARALLKAIINPILIFPVSFLGVMRKNANRAVQVVLQRDHLLGAITSCIHREIRAIVNSPSCISTGPVIHSVMTQDPIATLPLFNLVRAPDHIVDSPITLFKALLGIKLESYGEDLPKRKEFLVYLKKFILKVFHFYELDDPVMTHMLPCAQVLLGHDHPEYLHAIRTRSLVNALGSNTAIGPTPREMLQYIEELLLL